MASIPQEVIQDIRSKVDIVDVVNQYIQLTKRGTNYITSCPFHEDRNPSFSVSQPKQIYKCFSCGRGGNVFGFLQEIEGISFVESVQKAAEYANISLDDRYLGSNVASSKAQQYQPLYDIHDKAKAFYHYYLMNTTNGEEAYNYLHQRSLTDDTLDTFKIGLSPSNSQLLEQYLKQEGFNDTQLIESGIFYQTDNQQLIDRFNGRIIIPLNDMQSRTIGFSGRVYSKTDNSGAKYLNSPQTDIFDKSRLLFNLDNARLPIRNQNLALVCEGYMDVIALHEAGFDNSVASMGTSLTLSHLEQLSKLAQTVVFVFDGDSAGQKATHRAFELSSSIKNGTFKSISIPNQMDPDDWLRQKGRDSFQNLLNQASSSYEFRKEYLKQQYNLTDDQQLAQYIEKLTELIAQINSPIEQQLRVQDLVNEYQLSEALINEQVARNRQHFVSSKNKTRSQANYLVQSHQQIPTEPKTVNVFNIKSQRAFQSEKLLLFSLIYYQEAWNYVDQMDEPIFLLNEISRNAYLALQTFYYDEGQPLPLTGIINVVEDSQLQQFFSDLIWEKELFDFHTQMIDDSLSVIDEEFIRVEIQELKGQMQQYQKEQDFNQLNQVITQISRLTRKIKH